MLALRGLLAAGALLAACGPGRSDWSTYSYRDPMTDAVEWHASASAGDPDHPRATLVFTCGVGVRQVALLTRDRLLDAGPAADTPVRYRIDSAPPVPSFWRLGPDGHSAVTDPEPVAKLLTTARERVVLGWQTADGAQPVAEFRMTGFRVVADSLRGPPCRLRM